MPEPHSPPPDEPTGIVEYIQELIDDVESGYPAWEQWSEIRCIFNKLACKPKLTPKQKHVFNMLEPIVQKYGLNDGRGVKLSSQYPHERKED
jgi:hypothetical protein